MNPKKELLWGLWVEYRRDGLAWDFLGGPELELSIRGFLQP